MKKAEALHQFWSSFDLLAIDENSAYDTKMELPDNYITYEVRTANLSDESIMLTASLWYKSTSWLAIQQKADEIARFISYGGKLYAIDGGYMWIKLGTPFTQRMAVEELDSVRRIILNISVDFLTET